MAARPSRTNDEMSAATQKALLASAVRLFAAKGYRSTTTLEIAQDAGVTKGALYHHFPTKEALLQRIHDEITETVLGVLDPIAEADLDPTEMLEQLLRAHMDAVEKRGNEIAVVVHERRELSAPTWKEVRRRRDAVERIYIDVIVAGQRDRSFSADLDPRIAAYGILGMINWVSEWYRPGKVPPQEIARIFGAIAVNGLRGAGT